jgi:hypothetical protein
MDKKTIFLTNYNDHINFDHVLISSDNKFLVTWGNGTIIKTDEWDTYNSIEGKIRIFKLTTSEKPTEITFNDTIKSGIADVKLSPDNNNLVVIMRGEDPQLDMGDGRTTKGKAALIYDFNKITGQTSEEAASGGRRQSRRHRRQSRRRRQTRKR